MVAKKNTASSLPIRFFLAMLTTVFVAEIGVMFLVFALLPTDASLFVEALSDATLLTIFCSPLIWWIAVHPLRQLAIMETSRAFSIVNTAADPIITITDEGIVEQFNAAAERVFGYSQSEILGRNVNMLMPSSYREAHDGHLNRYTSTGTTHVIGKNREVIGMRKSGELFPIQISVNEVFNESNEKKSTRCLTGTIRDLTEQKKHVESLRLQSAALESAANAIVISDRNGRIIWTNHAFSQLVGYSREEVVGRETRMLKSGQHDATFYADLWRTVLAGKVWHGEMVNRRKDGSLYTEESTITPVVDERGEITHFIAVKQDITERKNAEAKVLESEYRYRKLFEGSSDAILLVDDTGIINCNAATLPILGVTDKNMVISRHPTEFSPPMQPDGVDSITKVQELNARAFREGAAKFEWICRRANGEDFPAEIWLTACNLGDRRVLQATIRDVSRQKQLQCELTQAQKLESVGQLAAGIAHEINTPTQYVGDNTRFLKETFGDICTVLDSFEKLLQAAKDGTVDEQLMAEVEATLKQADVEYLTEEIPQAIEQSLNGIEQVAKIVRAMKEFSHPGSEEKSMINLTKAIETTITVARNEWKYVAEMVTEFDPELSEVSCLPGEVNQVFLNLIVNAAHAIGDTLGDDGTKKGTIRVGTRRDGEWAEVFVRDTGTGIPENIRARIFDPFFTTKEVGKGTGQGLAIARSVVVDKHGGTINCETELGKGTTFIVRLPIDGKRHTQKRRYGHEEACSIR